MGGLLYFTAPLLFGLMREKGELVLLPFVRGKLILHFCRPKFNCSFYL